MTEPEHAARVASIRRHIEAGDTYQVNLTFPMTASFDGDPAALFTDLIAAQPASFGALIDTGDEIVVSASPEMFLEVDGRRVITRPMKGTAPRGRWAAEDLARAEELAQSPKERAGNVMVVDMIRNDLGRVARTGGVTVPALYELERHPTVWQMTSTIAADLAERTGLPDLIRATFPSGSVTGAPKGSTMAIIAAEEVGPRGPYCGAIGYVAPGARQAQFSVAIRTGVIRGGHFTYHVGGGITHDSDAAAEYAECLWKALVVTRPAVSPDLLESMRVEPGVGIPLLEAHVSRLRASAGYWGIPFDPGAIGDALSAVNADRPAKVRLVLAADGGVDIGIEAIEEQDSPVTLHLSDPAVDPDDPMWYHKTLDRRRYPDSDDSTEIVMVNLSGQVSETNRSNLFALIDGQWVTPPLGSGCLPGVSRQGVLSRGEAVEAVITVDDLRRSEQLAVTNAVRGWRKAVLFG